MDTYVWNFFDKMSPWPFIRKNVKYRFRLQKGVKNRIDRYFWVNHLQIMSIYIWKIFDKMSLWSFLKKNVRYRFRLQKAVKNRFGRNFWVNHLQIMGTYIWHFFDKMCLWPFPRKNVKYRFRLQKGVKRRFGSNFWVNHLQIMGTYIWHFFDQTNQIWRTETPITLLVHLPAPLSNKRMQGLRTFSTKVFVAFLRFAGLKSPRLNSSKSSWNPLALKIYRFVQMVFNSFPSI